MLRPSDFFRIKPGKLIDGIFYHHVETFDPLDESWHSIRACADKADALVIRDRLIRIVEKSHKEAQRR